MPRNRYVVLFGILIALLLANVVYYLYEGWGLITVQVTDAPISQVLSSIEWQGWVKIYSNVPLESKVTMNVYRVPLAEAMETLVASVTMPPRPPPAGGMDGAPPAGTPSEAVPAPASPAPVPAVNPAPLTAANRSPFTLVAATGPDAIVPGAPGSDGGAPPPGPSSGGPPNGSEGAAPSDSTPGADPNVPGGRGGRRGGGGFGGFGGGLQWNLAFFVAPTSARVKEEINTFVAGTPDADLRVYTYPTPFFQLVSSNGDDMPAADPRLQSWPGYKLRPPTPASAPALPTDATPAGDATAAGMAPAVPAADAAPTVQTCLRSFAESSNIWIMAPGSWDEAVANPPPANSSIIRAVTDFIGNVHGAVTRAIILRVGRGLARVRTPGDNPGGGPPGGFLAGTMDDATADRLRNAINGLPEDARADALNQVDQEVKFRQEVQAAPTDQQQKLVQDHMQQKMANGFGGGGRQSPEKRAKFFQRVVNNREVAQGKK